MKKHFLFNILFITVLAFTTQAKSQCPTGYTPRQINMVVNGCPYEVDLCVKCLAVGSVPGSVLVTGFKQIPTVPPCVQTLTAKQVLQYIETYVSTYDFYYTWLCQNPHNPPPCPDQSEEIEIWHWSCWQIDMVEYFGEEVLYYHVCNLDYEVGCYEKISWCYDPVNNIYQRTVVEGPIQIGVPPCSLEAWEITIPTEVGQQSDCFIMHNACQ